MYGLLGKIKANLIARGLSMEWLFKRERWIKKEVGGGGMMEEEIKRRMEKDRGGRIEEKGGRKEVGGGMSKEEGGGEKNEGDRGRKWKERGKREEEGGGEEEGVLGKEEFGRRVAEMIGGEKEGRRMANFLAEGGEEIRLRIFLFYLRKVGVKEVFLGEEEEEGRRLVEEVKRMREEVERRWGSTSKLEVLEVRQILEKSDFDNEIIDRILVKWVDLEEGGVDKKEFFKKMEDMMKMYKDEWRREEEERGEEDRGRKEGGGGINLRDLLTQEVGKTDKFLIRKFKYTERLVNLIRGKGREEIGRVLGVCRRVAESERGGRMNLNSFLNVLKYNVSDIPNSLLQEFGNEQKAYVASNTFEFEDFFNYYLIDPPSSSILPLPPSTSSSTLLNKLFGQIGEGVESSNVNVYYVLKFFDREEKGKIHRSDFKQLLVWLNLKIDEQTQNLLVNRIWIERGI